jgi:hypothetical protein
MSNIVQGGEGILSVLLIFYRCFINFLPRLSEKALNTNISPTVIYGNDAGFEV